jgi:hypothetical protein
MGYEKLLTEISEAINTFLLKAALKITSSYGAVMPFYWTESVLEECGKAVGFSKQSTYEMCLLW